MLGRFSRMISIGLAAALTLSAAQLHPAAAEGGSPYGSAASADTAGGVAVELQEGDAADAYADAAWVGSGAVGSGSGTEGNGEGADIGSGTEGNGEGADADGRAGMLGTGGTSVFGFVAMPADSGIQMMALDAGSVVTWGSVQNVTPSVSGGTWTWDVSATTRRYVEIPVEINVSGTESLEITLPLYVTGNVRGGGSVRCDHTGVIASSWTVTEDGSNVVLRYSGSGGGGQHGSVMVTYRFDCWNVISGRDFSIPYAVKKGTESAQGTLTGRIVTGHGVEFDEYFFEWGDSDYSLSALGGADKYMAYIPKWSYVYEKYFGLGQGEFDGDRYLYDVAPFLVKPTGQQPYGISGTLTLDQGGEVIGAVYMMDSVKGEDAPWKRLTVNGGGSVGSYTFAFGEGEKFESPNDGIPLEGKAVTGNLEDIVDNKNYTLYFLVRYPKASLDKSGKGGDNIKLEANLSLTHKGIDSHDEKKADGTSLLYEGRLSVDQRIYWASYVDSQAVNPGALSAMAMGRTAAVSFAADFFCLNEARAEFDPENPEKYTLKAIIDLTYLTGGGTPLQQSPQLKTGDYRFSSFNLSLVDAAGSWSQDWNYQDDDSGGWRGTPNVGWTKETWGNTGLAQGCGGISVYGSTSLEGDSWEPIETVPAERVWAINQDRGFREAYHIIGNGKNYLRLKVEYESSRTTALRVGYQLELQPGVLDAYGLQDVDSQEITCWLNYLAYKNGAADREYMKFQRYPASDAGATKADAGTVEPARQYDRGLSGITGFNDSDNVWEEAYSMRNFAKATLGRYTDSAGMLVTQALYDSNGKLVGDPNSVSVEVNDSYCLKDTVINVSEIVYNLTGAITDGSPSPQDLETYRKALPADSPYKALKMRYYILLPKGMKLNEAPVDHYSSAGTEGCLSAAPSFYNGNSSKKVQEGQSDVPVSDANIPGWQRVSGNGALSEMLWAEGGAATVDHDETAGRLVVFERTLSDGCLTEKFNMWGNTEVCYWGRGLSFSAVPAKGTGTLAAGKYTTHIWCQYLDADGKPIPLDGFGKGVEDVQAGLLGGQSVDADADTLLYIPIGFTNRSASGSTSAAISLESSTLDAYGVPAVEFGKSYQYRLEYAVDDRTSSDVILWANIEQEDGINPKYAGTVTGISLDDLPEDVRRKVKVYVRKGWFTADDYTSASSPAVAAWLTDGSHGWEEVPDPSTYPGWAGVKAVAFYFEGQEFSAEGVSSAAVHVKMQAPDESAYAPSVTDETTFAAVSPLVFSDSLQGEQGDVKACTPANRVPVSVTLRAFTLPDTGGPGTGVILVCGLFACLAGLALSMAGRKRRIL